MPTKSFDIALSIVAGLILIYIIGVPVIFGLKSKEQTRKPIQTDESTVKSLGKQGQVIAIFRNKTDQKLFDKAPTLLKAAKELLANLEDADATLDVAGEPYEDIVNLQKAIAAMETPKLKTD